MTKEAQEHEMSADIISDAGGPISDAPTPGYFEAKSTVTVILILVGAGGVASRRYRHGGRWILAVSRDCIRHQSRKVSITQHGTTGGPRRADAASDAYHRAMADEQPQREVGARCPV